MRRLALVLLLVGGCDDRSSDDGVAGESSSSESSESGSEDSSSDGGSSSSSDGYPMVDCVADGCECAERGHCQMACQSSFDCMVPPWEPVSGDDEWNATHPNPVPCVDGFCEWNPVGCQADGYCGPCVGDDNSHSGWCRE